MLESVFIMLLVFAIILLICTYEWLDPVFSILDAVIWLLLALAVMDIERPYEVVIGGVVTDGTRTISMPEISYLFLGVSLIMFFVFAYHAIRPIYMGIKKK